MVLGSWAKRSAAKLYEKWRCLGKSNIRTLYSMSFPLVLLHVHSDKTTRVSDPHLTRVPFSLSRVNKCVLEGFGGSSPWRTFWTQIPTTPKTRFIEAFEEDSALHIVFEWAAAGDLKRQIQKMRKRKSHFSERVIWKYFLQISKGLTTDFVYWIRRWKSIGWTGSPGLYPIAIV